MEQQYDYKRLIDIYLETLVDDMYLYSSYQSDADEYNDALRAYYRELLAALEKLFEINFSNLSTSHTPFAILFRKTVASYCKISSPWSDFLDATLIIRRLEQQGDAGEQVLHTSDRITKLNEHNGRHHREMLYQLFLCLYGDNKKVVTSTDLRNAGFDDTRKPDYSQYD